MSTRYHVMVTSETNADGATPESATITVEVLSLYVDQLHEAGVKLTALYPAPVVKRTHRRKGVEGTGFERGAR